MKQICNVDIVFVLNLKQYFSTEDLREIYKHCFYTKMYLINLEGVKSDSIESDRYIIIDKRSLCAGPCVLTTFYRKKITTRREPDLRFEVLLIRKEFKREDED